MGCGLWGSRLRLLLLLLLLDILHSLSYMAGNRHAARVESTRVEINQFSKAGVTTSCGRLTISKYVQSGKISFVQPLM